MSITLRENMLKALRHEEPDYLPLSTDMSLVVCPAIRDRAGSAAHPQEEDWFGRKWVYEPNIGGNIPDITQPFMDDITQWKDLFHFPDVETAVDWETLAAEAEARHDRENKLVLFMSQNGMWENLFNSMEFTDALTSLLEEPEACYDFFGAIADYKIQLHEQIIKHFKPDILMFHDDYGGGHGLFMSPDVWRELIKPHLKRIVDHCHAHGVIFQMHCCGYMAPLLDDMIELGIQTWHLVHVSNKPVELYQKYGKKITFVDGMLDNQMIVSDYATEEQIRKMIRDTVDGICPGGAPVVMSANANLRPDRAAMVKEELLNAAEKYYKEKRPV